MHLALANTEGIDGRTDCVEPVTSSPCACWPGDARISIVHHETGLSRGHLRALYRDLHQRSPKSGQLPAVGCSAIRSRRQQVHGSLFAALYAAARRPGHPPADGHRRGGARLRHLSPDGGRDSRRRDRPQRLLGDRPRPADRRIAAAVLRTLRASTTSCPITPARLPAARSARSMPEAAPTIGEERCGRVAPASPG